MLNKTLFEIKCNFCKEGTMHYNQKFTFDAYSIPENFVLEDIDKIVDGIIGEYLVYVCNKCGSVEKFTYKELEKIERRRISQIVINSVARGEIAKSGALIRKNKILIFCGKCNGVDGKGSCLLEIYEKCELKRFPNEL